YRLDESVIRFRALGGVAAGLVRPHARIPVGSGTLKTPQTGTEQNVRRRICRRCRWDAAGERGMAWDAEEGRGGPRAAAGAPALFTETRRARRHSRRARSASGFRRALGGQAAPAM